MIAARPPSSFEEGIGASPMPRKRRRSWLKNHREDRSLKRSKVALVKKREVALVKKPGAALAPMACGSCRMRVGQDVKANIAYERQWRQRWQAHHRPQGLRLGWCKANNLALRSKKEVDASASADHLQDTGKRTMESWDSEPSGPIREKIE